MIAAVQRLQADGHDVEAHLIERMPNTQALEIIAGADIFIDQLLFGYALAALEGLALGKVVISGLDDSAALPAVSPLVIPRRVPDRRRPDRKRSTT